MVWSLFSIFVPKHFFWPIRPTLIRTVAATTLPGGTNLIWFARRECDLNTSANFAFPVVETVVVPGTGYEEEDKVGGNDYGQTKKVL